VALTTRERAKSRWKAARHSIVCDDAVQGAISGMLGGLVITLWISVGAALYAPVTPTLPVGACQLHNDTVVLTSPTSHNASVYMHLDICRCERRIRVISFPATTP